MDRTSRNLLIALGVVASAILLLSMFTGMMAPGVVGDGALGTGMMPGHGWMWGLGMGFGGVAMVLFWGVLILGVILLARAAGLAGSAREGPGARSPLDVLKHRYAAGEITREQFEQTKRDLQS